MRKLAAVLALVLLWWSTGANTPADDDQMVKRFRENGLI